MVAQIKIRQEWKRENIKTSVRFTGPPHAQQPLAIDPTNGTLHVTGGLLGLLVLLLRKGGVLLLVGLLVVALVPGTMGLVTFVFVVVVLPSLPEPVPLAVINVNDTTAFSPAVVPMPQAYQR
jgi:hypothetical protein